MSSKYIYAGTRSTALKRNLLTADQLDVLLGGENFSDSFQSLHETFMAPYVARRESQDLSLALEEAITDTKKLLQKISPEPELLDILWLKYDFHNLMAIIKGTLAGLGDQELRDRCFTTGKFAPGQLIEKYQADKLNHLDPRLHQAAQEAKNYREVSDIALATNTGYLLAAREIASKHRNNFVREYVGLIIDFYNVQANLRAFTYGQIDEAPLPLFIPGGRFTAKDLESVDSILTNLHRIGGRPDFWQEAIDGYRQSRSYFKLEKACDDHLSRFLQQSSRDIFSIAPLFSYFHARKNNVQLIKTILTGKKTNLEEFRIRQILRERY